MRLSFLNRFALLLPLAALACGSDPEPAAPAPPPPPPVDAASFMDAYTSALCDRAARCYVTAAYLDAACDDNVRSLFGEDVEAAIAGGRVTYDADAAGACIAGLAAMGCLAEQPSDATLAACLGALSGKIETGKPCFGTFECAFGVCRSTTGDACPTVCEPVAKAGEACSFLGGPDCDARAGLRCSQGTCVAPVGEGAVCADNYGCQSGLVCVANACVPLRAEGYGCAQDSSCALGNYCASGGDEGGACRPRLPSGAACGGGEAEYTNAAFRHVQCEDGLICILAELEGDGTSLGGICGTPSDVGGHCTVEPSGKQVFETGCKGGLVCVAGKCAMPPALGEACSAHFLCEAQTYCDPTTILCAVPKANGEPCLVDRECERGLCGSMGTCTDQDTFCGP